MIFYCRCGFYGNTIYRGYCSKCFKEVQQLAEPSHEQPTELLDPGKLALPCVYYVVWLSVYTCVSTAGVFELAALELAA